MHFEIPALFRDFGTLKKWLVKPTTSVCKICLSYFIS